MLCVGAHRREMTTPYWNAAAVRNFFHICWKKRACASAPNTPRFVPSARSASTTLLLALLQRDEAADGMKFADKAMRA